MTALARLVLRHKRAIVFLWLALTLIGAYSANAVSKRWLEQFSIPGYSAYEANQRALKTFGTGENAPLVAVFQSDGDVTKVTGIKQAIAAAERQNPGSRVSSYFSTGSDAYVSRDRHTTFAELYPPGNQGFNGNVKIGEARTALKEATPPGVTSYLTGRDALQEASSGGDKNGPSVFLEALIGGLGAIVILLFVFGTVPAVLIPIGIAISSILNTFTLVYLLTYVTSVSLIVQFLVALVGLGVAIDYSLLMIFRFREELANGEDTDTAIIETMRHAGRSVIVSGSTVAIGLLSMVILPIPVIRSIGIGGMLIPAVSVLSSITLLPAMLAMLGPRINRLRVMPHKFVDPHPAEAGPWWRWSRLVLQRPGVVFAVGAAIVVLVLIPAFQINPSDAVLANEPAKGDALAGRAALDKAGLPPGVLLPYEILVEHSATPAVLDKVAAKVAADKDIAAATAPKAWRTGDTGLVEAFGREDANSR